MNVSTLAVPLYAYNIEDICMLSSEELKVNVGLPFSWIGSESSIVSESWIAREAWIGSESSIASESWIAREARIGSESSIASESWIAREAWSRSSRQLIHRYLLCYIASLDGLTQYSHRVRIWCE